MVVAILLDPASHIRKIYELTGPRSEDLHLFASRYTTALGRSVRNAPMPLDEWRHKELSAHGLPRQVYEHFLIMSEFHAANRYDRLTSYVQAVLGRPLRPIESMVQENRSKFGEAQLRSDCRSDARRAALE